MLWRQNMLNTEWHKHLVQLFLDFCNRQETWRIAPTLCDEIIQQNVKHVKKQKRVERRWSPRWRIIQLFFISLFPYFRIHSRFPSNRCLSASSLHFQCVFQSEFQFWTFFKLDLNFSTQPKVTSRAASSPDPDPPDPPRPTPPPPERDHGSTSTPAANASSHDNGTTTHGHYWHCFSLLL